MGKVSKRNMTIALFSMGLLMVGYQNCSKLNMENAPGGSEKAIFDQVGNTEIPGSEVTVGELPDMPVSQPGTPVVNEQEREPAQEPSKDTGLPRQEVMQPIEEREDEAVDFEGNNRFTAIQEDSFLLACGKQINSITEIAKTAKVVLVNSNLSRITNVKGELLLVNSRSSKPTGGQENIRAVTSADEIALWEARCKAYEVEDINENDDAFELTRVGPGDTDKIPKSAPSYRFTSIGDVELVNLHTNFFKATAINQKSTVKVKTENFRFTTLTKGSVLELY